MSIFQQYYGDKAVPEKEPCYNCGLTFEGYGKFCCVTCQLEMYG